MVKLTVLYYTTIVFSFFKSQSIFNSRKKSMTVPCIKALVQHCFRPCVGLLEKVPLSPAYGISRSLQTENEGPYLIFSIFTRKAIFLAVIMPSK